VAILDGIRAVFAAASSRVPASLLEDCTGPDEASELASGVARLVTELPLLSSSAIAGPGRRVGRAQALGAPPDAARSGGDRVDRRLAFPGAEPSGGWQSFIHERAAENPSSSRKFAGRSLKAACASPKRYARAFPLEELRARGGHAVVRHASIGSCAGRDVLRVAAVLGRVFSLRPLAGDGRHAEFLPSASTLEMRVRRRLPIADEERYVFRTRHAGRAYDSLCQRRNELHAARSRHRIDLRRGSLAPHYEMPRRALRAQRQLEKAIHYGERAGP